MLRHGTSTCLSFLSRTDLREAALHVWLRGGEAPGLDGRTRCDVFGDGPRSGPFHETLRRLGRRKRSYTFGPIRTAQIFDHITGKRRLLAIPSFDDRIVLHAVADVIRNHLPWSRINVCRPGCDARWSVAMAALALAEGEFTCVLRSDFSKAFPSLIWREVLQMEAAQTLPAPVTAALIGIYTHFSPTGVGVPMGLPTSPLMLDIACSEFDLELSALGKPVYRYVDDLLIFSGQPDLSKQFERLIEKRLSRFGIRLNEAKTGVHFDRPAEPVSCPTTSPTNTSSRSFDWLGHSLEARGVVDISEAVADRLRCADSDSRKAAEKAFVLAERGARFRHIFGRPELRQVYTIKSRQPHDPDRAQGEGSKIPASSVLKVAPSKGPNNSVGSLGNTIIPHPNLAPGVSPTDGLGRAAELSAGGYGRGGRGGARPRPPRPNRNLRSLWRSGLFSGPLEVLGTAASIENHPSLGYVLEPASRILFGVGAAKVQQLRRAYAYWGWVQETLWSAGARIAPIVEDEVLEDVWSVLMSASTVTQTDAVYSHTTDPLFILLQRLAGSSASSCRREIAQERLARDAGLGPRHISLLGSFIGVVEPTTPMFPPGWSPTFRRSMTFGGKQ